MSYAVCLDPKTLVSGYKVPLEEEIRFSDFITIGQVIESYYLPDPVEPEFIAATIYAIRVTKQLKGKLPELIHIRSKNDSGTYWMETGEQHVLFLKKDEQHFIIDSCGNSSLLPQGNNVFKRVENLLN